MSANVLVVNRIILGGGLHGQTTDTVHRSMAGGRHACAAVVVVLLLCGAPPSPRDDAMTHE